MKGYPNNLVWEDCCFKGKGYKGSGRASMAHCRNDDAIFLIAADRRGDAKMGSRIIEWSPVSSGFPEEIECSLKCLS